MKHALKTSFMIPLTVVVLAGCRTAQPEPEPVVIIPEPVRTCFPRNELVAETIPAETRTYMATVLIDNPPGPPIEQTEPVERVIREAYTVYKDTSGNEVTEDMICSEDIVSNPTGL